MQKEKKPKVPVFSEEIDSKINGLALGCAFIFIGLFLLYVPDYFGSRVVGQIIRWIFIAIGLFGLFAEFSKLKPISNIKGFDDLWVGVILLAVWLAIFLITRNWIFNTLGFFLLIFGIFGSFKGLITIIYSIHQNRKNQEKTKGAMITNVLLFLTKVFSLALVVLQFVKAIQQWHI